MTKRKESTNLFEKGKTASRAKMSEEAVKFYRKALTLSRKECTHELSARILYHHALEERIVGNETKAIKLCEKAIRVASDHCKPKFTAQTFIMISSLYFNMMEYKKGIKLADKAGQLSYKNGHWEEYAYSLGFSALYCELTMRYRKAIYYKQKILLYQKKARSKNNQVITLTDIGLLYAKLGDHTNALACIKRGEDISKQYESHEELIYLYLAKCRIFQIIGDRVEASISYDKHLGLVDEHDFTFEDAKEGILLADCIIDSDSYQLAQKNLHDLLTQCERLHLDESIPDVMLRIALTHKSTGSYDDALHWYWQALNKVLRRFNYRIETVCMALEGLVLTPKGLGKSPNGLFALQIVTKFKELYAAESEGSPHFSQKWNMIMGDWFDLLIKLKKGVSYMFMRQDIRVDLIRGDIYKKGKKARKGLTPTELRIFQFLVTNEGSVVKYDALIEYYDHTPGTYQNKYDRLKVYLSRMGKTLEPYNVIKKHYSIGVEIPRL